MRRYSVRLASCIGTCAPPSAARTGALAMLAALTCHVAIAEGAPFTSTYVARWNLSHGSYLIDRGLYFEALEALETAIEMSDDELVRADGMIQKASVLAVFFDAPVDAVSVYDLVFSQYPGSSAAETALFRAAMVLFDIRNYGRAIDYFERYLATYPQGRSHATAEFLLERSRVLAQRAPERPVEKPQAIGVRIRLFGSPFTLAVHSTVSLEMQPDVSHARGGILSARDGKIFIDGSDTGARVVTVTAQKSLQVSSGSKKRRLRGRLVVRAGETRLEVVNELDLEQYLYGVVTKEVPRAWPREALRAQAVASRTYALYQAERRRDRTYDMVDDERSQVYGGVDGESAAGRAAVDDTRGMVLLHQGRPIYAMFTSNAGWYTADPRYVFNQPLPYLTSRRDPYSPGELMGRWTRSYTVDEVRSRLSEVIGEALPRLLAVRPAITDPSGRVIYVDIVDEGGTRRMRTRPTLGRAMDLPEILLDIRRDRDRFVFSGGGFGHGVGMSQWGARAMAVQGFAASEILAFYYRGAELRGLGQ